MHVRKGDTVAVLAGKDKGKQGKVIRAIPKENRVVVEKVNLVKRHLKPSPKNPNGGIVTMEAPIHASNVMLVCKACNRPTRVGKRFLDNGAKVRVCKRCGATID
ncbi:MAG: 50S ribosomal protein L24 [Firmicutes bacterium]|nr:50S ribosomal protein L24 [Alicyclobacillaceae bacterium]MCL6497974.1 50S ribosomal protein L24 [Bacillota bacterium]